MPTLLIVDDEANIRSSLEGALTREGYQVDTAASVAEGKAKLRESYDFVLLDVWFPDGSGLDLLALAMETADRKSTRLNSSHSELSRMPSSA